MFYLKFKKIVSSLLALSLVLGLFPAGLTPTASAYDPTMDDDIVLISAVDSRTNKVVVVDSVNHTPGATDADGIQPYSVFQFDGLLFKGSDSEPVSVSKSFEFANGERCEMTTAEVYELLGIYSGGRLASGVTGGSFAVRQMGNTSYFIAPEESQRLDVWFADGEVAGSVSSSGTGYVSFSGLVNSGDLTFVNQRKFGLRVFIYDPFGSFDSGSDVSSIADTEFRVYKDGVYLYLATFVELTDDGKMASFIWGGSSGLVEGMYTIEQTVWGDGYAPTYKNTYDVYIDPYSDDCSEDPISGAGPNGIPWSRSIYIPNTKYPEITINCYDSDGYVSFDGNGGVLDSETVPVTGAKFELMVNGVIIPGTVSTDSAGVATIDWVTVADYFTSQNITFESDAFDVGVRQTFGGYSFYNGQEYASAYLIDNTEWVFTTVTIGEVPSPFVFTVSKTPSIVVRKVDRDTGVGVFGAEFGLFINGEYTFSTCITDSDGYAYFDLSSFVFIMSDNDSWVITIEELRQPNGYNHDVQITSNTYSQNAIVKYGQSTAMLEFTNAPYRSVEVLKYDSEMLTSLGGATFALKEISLDDSSESWGTQELVTGSNGSLVFTGVPNGVYELWEVSAPVGYAKDDRVVIVEVTSGSAAIMTYQFYNDPLGTVEINSYGSGVSTPLEGIVYLVEALLYNGVDTTDMDNLESHIFANPGEATWTVITDASGNATISYLPTGYYRVTEMVTSEDYLLNNEPQVMYVFNRDASTVYTFFNDVYPEIHISKIGSRSNAPLSGAYFEVRVDGSLVGTVGPTDDNGSVVVSSEEFEEYLNELKNEKNQWTIGVTEVIAPSGHFISNPEEQYIELVRGQKIAPFVFSDDAYTQINISLTDYVTGNPVAWNTFNVTIDGFQIGNFVTDDGGKIVITHADYCDAIDETNMENNTWELVITHVDGDNRYNIAEEDTQIFWFTFRRPLIEASFEADAYKDVVVTSKDVTTGWLLEGTEVTLEGVSDYGDVIVRTGHTSAGGIVTFENLPNGEYTVYVSSHVNGYFGSDIESFNITHSDEYIIYKTLGSSPLGGALIQVIDATTKQGIQGVSLVITSIEDPSVVITATTNAGGYIVLEDLPIGDYSVVETGSVDGYKSTPLESVLSISSDHESKVLTLMKEQTNMLTVLRVGGTGNIPLSGAKFLVSLTNGTEVATIETGAFGYATLANLDIGNYVVTEIEAPSGYMLNTESQTFNITVSDVGKNVSLTFGGVSQATLRVAKYDSVTGLPVANASFELTTLTGKIIETLTTDESGSVYYMGGELETGTYLVKELEVDGYVTPEDAHEIKIVSGQAYFLTTYAVPFGGVKVSVRSEANDEVIGGVTIDLTNELGGVVASGTTDINGNLYLSDIESGLYLLKITNMPDGYSADELSRPVYVDEGKLSEVNWLLDSFSGLLILSTDSLTSAPLTGVEFDFTTATGSLVAHLITNEFGMASFENLVAGVYYLTETNVPDGYLSNEEPVMIVVKNNEPTTVLTSHAQALAITIINISADTQLPVSGSVFQIIDSNGDVVATVTTESNGIGYAQNLPAGEYVVRQIVAPHEYMLIGEFTITHSGSTPTVITVYSTPTGSIQILYQMNDGSVIGGATFDVMDSDNNVVATVSTDITGMAYTGVLPVGAYTVKQTIAPSGYTLMDTVYEAFVVTDEAYKLVITNGQMTSFVLRAIDSVTGSGISGVSFDIYDSENEFVTSLSTGADGTSTSSVLDAGIYKVVPTSISGNYILDETPSSVNVVSGVSRLVTFEFESHTTLTVFHRDDMSSSAIEGTTFTVTSVTGDLIGVFTTDSTGQFVVTGLTPGVYTVEEVASDLSYTTTGSTKTINVEGNKNNYLEFFSVGSGSLVIDISDVVTHDPLANAVFTVVSESGETVFSGQSDITGRILIGNLNSGVYTVTQMSAPDGYYMTTEIQTVTVTAHQTQFVYFKNVSGGIVIQSLTTANEPIQNAIFKVLDSTGRVVGEYTSDQAGLCYVTDIIPGIYTIYQMSVPDGFSPNSERKEIEVGDEFDGRVTFYNIPNVGMLLQVLCDAVPVANVGVTITGPDEFYLYGLTDATGSYQSPVLSSGAYTVTVDETTLPSGYSIANSSRSVELTDGETHWYVFECIAGGGVALTAFDGSGMAVEGVVAELTDYHGKSYGYYTTGVDGRLVATGLLPNDYIFNIVEMPNGYEALATRVFVKVSNGEITEYKVTCGVSGGAQFIATDETTGKGLLGVTYEVYSLEGVLVETLTTDDNGTVSVSLLSGNYEIVLKSVPDEYALAGEHVRFIKISTGETTTVRQSYYQAGSLGMQFINGSTSAGIYNVRVMMTGSDGSIRTLNSDYLGNVRFTGIINDGTYTLSIISVPDGYTMDSIPRSIKVTNGHSTTGTWTLYQELGQIQISVRSSEYNGMLDAAEGSPVYGITYQIVNADTYQTVGYIISDANGIAASEGLPLGRYTISQVGVTQFYGMDSTSFEVRVKTNNDVVLETRTCPNLITSVDLALQTNLEVDAGASMRVDIKNLSSNSVNAADNFFFHLNIPTDAARIGTMATGTWKQYVDYRIVYKTNMSDYKVLADNLVSTEEYSFDLSTTALGLQTGEYVTNVMYEFGTIPANFEPVTDGAFMLYVLSTVPDNYFVITRAEIGGQYNGYMTDGVIYPSQWFTNTALWTTVVS